MYLAITGDSEYIYLGGFTKDAQIKPLSQSTQAVLTRMSIESNLNKIDWSVALTSADGQSLHRVTGLALHPTQAMMAVYASVNGVGTT